MNTKLKWTPTDEAALRELTQRRIDFYAAATPVVEDVVGFAFGAANAHLKERGDAQMLEMHIEPLAQALIARADAVRDALAPFDSGVRPEKPPQVAIVNEQTSGMNSGDLVAAMMRDGAGS